MNLDARSSAGRKLTYEERFWLKVEKTPGCWNWNGYMMKDGYGLVFFYGTNVMAHRAAYEMERGPIPEGLEIDHQCHNRACVRPSHLIATTHARNTQNRKGAQANSSSGVRGVSWNKKAKKWQARVFLNGRAYSAGYFHDLDSADKAAQAKREEIYSTPTETSK